MKAYHSGFLLFGTQPIFETAIAMAFAIDLHKR